LASLVRTGGRPARVILVANAKDHGTQARRVAKVAQVSGVLAAAGITVQELDLREHIDPSLLADHLAGAAAVWACGGNTFWLMHVMRASGFDVALRASLAAGLVYGGESAGAIVAGPSLRGLDLIDDPSVSPNPSQPGLGLVRFVPWPHWGSGVDRPSPVSRAAVTRAVRPNPVMFLNDGQVAVVSGDRVHIEGA